MRLTIGSWRHYEGVSNYAWLYCLNQLTVLRTPYDRASSLSDLPRRLILSRPEVVYEY